MRLPSHLIRRAGLWAILTVMAMPAVAAAQPRERRVLMLYSFERDYSPHNVFANLLRPDLGRAADVPLDIVEVSLQAARQTATVPDEAVAEQLREEYSTQRLDLVITIGGPAALFAQQYRKRLFPTTPLLMAGLDRRFLAAGPPANAAAVAIEFDPPKTIRTILEVLPDTRTIFVVLGSSPLERFWLGELQRNLKPFVDRVHFVFSNDLSFQDILHHCGSLPPHSAIFFGMLSLDAAGTPLVDSNTFPAIRDAANAPVFAMTSPLLGQGIVGGPLVSIEALSQKTAAIGARLMRGESPDKIAVETEAQGEPRWDWRELHRWGISEARLPAGSTVLFREPTAWERYRNPIVLGVTVTSAQALLVVALLVNLSRRRRADRLTPVATDAGVSKLAHRLIESHEHDRRRLAEHLRVDHCQRMAALTMRLQHVDTLEENEVLSGELAELTGELEAITDHSHASLQLLGLDKVARNLCRDVSEQHDLRVTFSNDGAPNALPDEIALALYRVLQEALRNLVTHASARTATVWLTTRAGAIVLQVIDQGVGFDAAAAMARGGVGLLAMRERMRLVGGECEVDSAPGSGTIIRASAPFPPAASAPAL